MNEALRMLGVADLCRLPRFLGRWSGDLLSHILSRNGNRFGMSADSWQYIVANNRRPSTSCKRCVRIILGNLLKLHWSSITRQFQESRLVNLVRFSDQAHARKASKTHRNIKLDFLMFRSTLPTHPLPARQSPCILITIPRTTHLAISS